MGDTPANQYGAMGSGRNRTQGQGMMPPIKDTPQGRSYQAHGLSQNASAVQLSVQDELAQIDEAHDLSHQGSHEQLPRGSREDLHRASNFSQQALPH